MKASRSIHLLAAAALAAGLQSGAALADVTDDAAAPVNEKYGLNVKKLFSQKCSWCHQGYGMKGADGPKLAGTSKSFGEVVTQIVVGKTPMPGFRKQLKPEEIQALAEYIKALPAD
ncbi:MAG TPA: cytochrome c [Burkholderiales bacterium]|nr:cytochrome c [Burkholderiales bacterium]